VIEIRIHGRGGQGAVLASIILARAAHFDGWNVQVFPEFGVERRGAPVAAFARLDRQPIYIRSKVYEPDHIIVFDSALMSTCDLTAGLKRGGWIVLNAQGRPSISKYPNGFKVASIDATAIAARHGIGNISSPIVNTAMVGSFAGATRLVSIEAVAAGIRETILSAAVESNVEAAEEAYKASIAS